MKNHLELTYPIFMQKYYFLHRSILHAHYINSIYFLLVLLVSTLNAGTVRQTMKTHLIKYDDNEEWLKNACYQMQL